MDGFQEDEKKMEDSEAEQSSAAEETTEETVEKVETVVTVHTVETVEAVDTVKIVKPAVDYQNLFGKRAGARIEQAFKKKIKLDESQNPKKPEENSEQDLADAAPSGIKIQQDAKQTEMDNKPQDVASAAPEASEEKVPEQESAGTVDSQNLFARLGALIEQAFKKKIKLDESQHPKKLEENSEQDLADAAPSGIKIQQDAKQTEMDTKPQDVASAAPEASEEKEPEQEPESEAKMEPELELHQEPEPKPEQEEMIPTGTP